MELGALDDSVTLAVFFLGGIDNDDLTTTTFLSNHISHIIISTFTLVDVIWRGVFWTCHIGVGFATSEKILQKRTR